MDLKHFPQTIINLADSQRRISTKRAQLATHLSALHRAFNAEIAKAESNYPERKGLVTCDYSEGDGLRLQVTPRYSMRIYCDEILGFSVEIHGFEEAQPEVMDAVVANSPLSGGRRLLGLVESNTGLSFVYSMPDGGQPEVPALEVLFGFVFGATQAEALRELQYNFDPKNLANQDA